MLPTATSQDDLLDLVTTLNQDDTVHAILVQLPLPAHISERAIIRAVDPAKDVDGFHPMNAGLLDAGDRAVVPCTPSGAMRLIESVRGTDLSGLEALVIGRSGIVGKPMAKLLLDANATVTIGHSRTPDLSGLCRRADVLVAAIGRPRMILGEWIKPGATVIDVGINRSSLRNGTTGSRLCGDVDFESASEIAGAITPVPGGVGPMTIAMLMSNTLNAARIALERTSNSAGSNRNNNPD